MRTLTAIFLILQAVPASCGVVSGRVLDPQGLPAPGVVLEYTDKETGVPVPLTPDTTDLLGLYSFPVPDGAYRVRYKPPAGMAWAALEETTVHVAGDWARPDIQLAEGLQVLAEVLDHSGMPVQYVYVDFYLTGTWTHVYANRNSTNPQGRLTTWLPCGVYDAIFYPPAGHPDSALRWGPIDACADVDVGTITLAQGVVLSGTVSERVSGIPVVTCDIDVLVPATGEVVPAARDKTDAAGYYSIVVPPGTWTVRAKPPAGSRALPATVDSLAVTGATRQDFPLETGVLLSGRVTEAAGGTPLEAASVAARDTATGVSAYLPNYRTDYAGRYRVALPAGTWDLDYGGPVGTRYVSVRFLAEPLPADRVLDVALEEGYRITGRVLRSSDLAPLPGVDTDVIHPVLGRFYTPGDDTGPDGRFTAVVPAGTGYQVNANPADTYVARSLFGVDVTADPTDLGDVLLDAGVEVRGRVLKASDRSPLAGVAFSFIESVAGPVLTPFAASGADGTFRAYVPEGTYTVHVKPGTALPVAPIQIPGLTVAFPGPADMGDIVLEDASLVTGRVVDDPTGAGIAEVTVAVDGASGSPYTPGNRTAADGSFALRLVPGVWTFHFNPPAGDSHVVVTFDAPAALPSTDLGTIRLGVGAWLRGRALRESDATPVESADIVVMDRVTGTLVAPVVRTDGAGLFQVAVLPGTGYMVDVKPPAGSGLVAVRINPVAIAPPETDLGDILLGAGITLRGTVRDPSGTGYLDADLDVLEAGTSTVLFTPGDNTGPDGTYAVVVPQGLYDVRVQPPRGSNLGWETAFGVDATADPTVRDFDLLWLLTGIAPGSGPTPGGTGVTVTGNRLSASVKVMLGGTALPGLSCPDSQSCDGVTGFHPAGFVDLTAEYPSGELGILPAAFEYVPNPNPPALTVRRVGADVLLAWSDTGQAVYTAVRSSDPGLASTTLLYQGPGFLVLDTGAVGRDALSFYDVE